MQGKVSYCNVCY